jgi:hypothetical protein
LIVAHSNNFNLEAELEIFATVPLFQLAVSWVVRTLMHCVLKYNMGCKGSLHCKQVALQVALQQLSQLFVSPLAWAIGGGQYAFGIAKFRILSADLNSKVLIYC